MKFFLHWSCLLIIALFAPIALPAGGAVSKDDEIIYTKKSIYYFAGESCFLLSSPYSSSPTVCKVELGTPIDIIRYWTNNNGQTWLQVKQSTNSFIFRKSNPSRGWINA